MPFQEELMDWALQFNEAVLHHNHAVDEFHTLYLSLFPSEASAGPGEYQIECHRWMDAWQEAPPSGVPSDSIETGTHWVREHDEYKDLSWIAGQLIAQRFAQWYLMRKYRSVQEVPGPQSRGMDAMRSELKQRASRLAPATPSLAGQQPESELYPGSRSRSRQAARERADTSRGQESSELPLLGTESDLASETAIQLAAQVCKGTLDPEQDEEGRLWYIRRLVRYQILRIFAKRGYPLQDTVIGDLWLDFAHLVAESEILRPRWEELQLVFHTEPKISAAWSRFLKLAALWGSPNQREGRLGGLKRSWRELLTEIRRTDKAPGDQENGKRENAANAAEMPVVQKTAWDNWQNWLRLAEERAGAHDDAGLAWQEFINALPVRTPLEELDRPAIVTSGDASEEDMLETEVKNGSSPSLQQEAEWHDRIRDYFLTASSDPLVHTRRCYTLLRLASHATPGEVAAEYRTLHNKHMPFKQPRHRKTRKGSSRPPDYGPIVSQDQRYNLQALSGAFTEDPSQQDVQIYRWVRSQALDTCVQADSDAWPPMYVMLQTGQDNARRPCAIFCWLWDMARPISAEDRTRLRQRQAQLRGHYLHQVIEDVAGIKVACILYYQIAVLHLTGIGVAPRTPPAHAADRSEEIILKGVKDLLGRRMP